MSTKANSNKTQDLNDLQANEQAFLADSTDDDIDLAYENTNSNEDTPLSANGDQGTEADNTDKTDDTGDTDSKTDENTKQQPPNQSESPKNTGINYDHPAAQPNVEEDVIEDEIDEDPPKTPEPPQIFI